MFTAYFDASGKPDSYLVTVAGYIASADRWTKIEAEWNKALTEFGLGFLHMSELKPDHRIGDILKRFATILTTWASYGIASSVETGAFSSNSFSLQSALLFAEPYCPAAMYSIMSVEDWAKRRNYNGPLAFVFENGDRKHEFLKAYNSAYRKFPKDLRSVTFAAKTRPALQSADMLAYLMRYGVSHEINGIRIPHDWRGEALTRLCRGVIQSRWYSKEQIEQLGERFDAIMDSEPGARRRLLGDRIKQSRRKRSRPH